MEPKIYNLSPRSFKQQINFIIIIKLEYTVKISRKRYKLVEK